MMNSTQQNFTQPTNPYQSFVVSASAGSGKTYQLSQRYLRLVAAGADPAEILTVTFTRKAAAEMQERIFSDAVQVLASAGQAEKIDREMQLFYEAALQIFSHLRPPRSAVEAAEAILSYSQSLKIQTIDSLFQELVQRFPVEAGSHIPIPFRIIDSIEKNELLEKAYIRLFEIAENPKREIPNHKFQMLDGGGFQRLGTKGDPEVGELLEAYLTYPGASVTKLREHLEYLLSERLFLWELQERHGKTYQDLLFSSQSEYSEYQAEELADTAAELLHRLASAIGKKTGENILAAAGEFQKTCDPKFLRGSVFKKNTWDMAKRVAEVCQPHETDELQKIAYELQRRILNRRAMVIFSLFEHYCTDLQERKRQARLVTFDALSIGVYNLFHNPESFGVRYHVFLRMSHLLVDEFQDTSRVQWDIFSAIAEELLSGEGLAAEKGLQPTVFLVGDAKQSIYSFRQGDYRLLGEAAYILESGFAASTVTMEKSWRSGQVILDQVNKVFSAPEYCNYLADFKQHSTAIAAGNPIVPPYGSFTLVEPAAGKSAEEKRQTEANQVVAILSNWLRQGKLIFDKETQGYRPIRYSDIGVLYRKTLQSEELEKALIRAGIPYLKEERRGYYKRREVEDVIAFLSFLAMPNDNIAVATLLRSPILRLPDADFMKMLAEMQKYEVQSRPSLFRLLEAHHPNFFEILQASLDRIGTWSIDHILLNFLERTRAFAGYTLSRGEDEGRLARANLTQLIEILGTAPPRTSGSILEYLDMLKEFRGVDETGNARLQSNSVVLMTMHKAKGLEFPVVVLLGAEASICGDAPRGKDSGFRKSLTSKQWPFVYIGSKKDERLPEIAEYRDYIREIETEEKKEGMRLLYVAMTRAQEHFIATATQPCGVDSFYTILQTGVFSDGTSGRCEIAPGVFGQAIRQENPNPKLAPTTTPAGEPDRAEIYIPDFDKPLPTSGIRLVQPNAGVFDEDQAALAKEVLQNSVHVMPFALAKIEKLQIIDALIHKGLQARLNKQEWEFAKSLQQAIDTAVQPFSDIQKDEIQETVQAHIDATWSSHAFQALLTGAMRNSVGLPILHLQGETLVDGAIDVLIENDNAYTIIDFKTDALEKISPEQIIERSGYRQQLSHYADAVAALYATDAVQKIVVFTESGVLIEV